MTGILVEPPLTGDRTYIHGADLFDALAAATGAETGIVLSLTAASDCAIELRHESSGPGAIAPCGRFRYVRAGTLHRRVLLRRPDLPIARRLPMDDEALVAGSTFLPGRAMADAADRNVTFMRRMVALAVALLERDFPDDYWSIAEISCDLLPSCEAAIEVAIDGSVGDRFWKVAVSADGARIGHLMLARGRPRR
jgi:hypothetical protein